MQSLAAAPQYGDRKAGLCHGWQPCRWLHLCKNVAMQHPRRRYLRAFCQPSDGSVFALEQLPSSAGTVRPGCPSAGSSADCFVFARW
jgi:hypothetical protein